MWPTSHAPENSVARLPFWKAVVQSGEKAEPARASSLASRICLATVKARTKRALSAPTSTLPLLSKYRPSPDFRPVRRMIWAASPASGIRNAPGLAASTFLPLAM